MIIIFNVLAYFFPIGIVQKGDYCQYWDDSYAENYYNGKSSYVVDTERKALRIAKSYMRTRDYIFSQPFKIEFDEKNRVWAIYGAPMQAPFLVRFGLKERQGFYENVLILVYEDGTVKYLRQV